jgi:ATP-binding cassette subfamily C (CFTR/MRP) protein 4
MLGSLFVVGLVNPFTLLVLVPAIPTFVYVRSSYVMCSREVKRIEAISRSPIYALFSSTLHGLQIVRAYKVGVQFFDRFTFALDNNMRPQFAYFTLGRWLGVRLDFMSYVRVHRPPHLSLVHYMH